MRSSSRERLRVAMQLQGNGMEVAWAEMDLQERFLLTWPSPTFMHVYSRTRSDFVRFPAVLVTRRMRAWTLV